MSAEPRDVAQMAERRPTILEVARLAGVSHQTVSRYLRFHGAGMKDATRERVSAAIADLDYRPNVVARAMRARTTGRLAMLLPLGDATGSLEMLMGATSAAQAAGYVLEAVTLGGPAPSRPGRVLELAESGLFDGVVSTTPLGIDARRAADTRTPIVVLPDYDEEMRGIGDLADATPIRELVERLVADGHRRFLHVAGDLAYTSARNRRDLYLESVESLGAESSGVIVADRWSPEVARRALTELPAGSGVTAVVCANDRLAVGAIRGAVERGWRVPDDVSITGWDDDPVAGFVLPSITSVAVDYEQLGRRATEQLLEVLSVEFTPTERTPVMRTIWRESTGQAPCHAARGPAADLTSPGPDRGA